MKKAGGEVLLVSGDDAKTLRTFREQKGPGLRYVADTDGELMNLYGVKMPLFNLASRTTFVIESSGRVAAVFTGGDAMDANKTVAVIKQIKK